MIFYGMKGQQITATTMIEYKSQQQIDYMRRAALIVHVMHERLRKAAVVGACLKDLDQICVEVMKEFGASSNFYGYYDYPAYSCISVNDVAVHGIPGNYCLKKHDIVSFDCGCYIESDRKQWHGDSAFTMIVGDEDRAPAPKRLRQLERLTYNAMVAGIVSLATGKTIAAVGDAVESCVEEAAIEYGWQAGIVEDYIGHGIGTQMHMDPDVYNYRVRGRQPVLRPGMVVCIEPIITLGSADVYTLDDEWTVKTCDYSMVAHWESEIALTRDGICVLNEPDCGKAMLEPYGVCPVVSKITL